MRVASFFSGIGGIDLGFEKAGMDVVFQCEILPFGKKILHKHRPSVKLEGDITKLTGDDIPMADIFVGGFPCQDLSLANQGKRKGLEGSRSGLFYKYAELIEEKRPRWVFIENVPGLLNSARGGDFSVVLSTLDELGYCVAWRVLDAKFFGTPQRRRRTYIVGSLGTPGAAEVLFESGTNPIANSKSNRTRNFVASGNDESLPESNIFSIQHAGIGRRASAGPQKKRSLSPSTAGTAKATMASQDAPRSTEQTSPDTKRSGSSRSESTFATSMKKAWSQKKPRAKSTRKQSGWSRSREGGKRRE